MVGNVTYTAGQPFCLAQVERLHRNLAAQIYGVRCDRHSPRQDEDASV